MWQKLCELLKGEDAPTMVEYGLLVALIAIVAIIGVAVFGEGVSSLFLVPPGYF